MKRFFLTFFFFSVPLFADQSLDKLVSAMQQKYEQIDSLQANFTQSYESKRFSDKIAETGVVYFQKGGLMRWEYQKPEKKIFASDGRTFSYYVPAEKQIIKMYAEDSGKHSPTLFLTGKGNFLKDFRAEWADPRPGSHLLKLFPVTPQDSFEYLIVDVDPVRSLIVRLLVIDSYENRTEYRFHQIKENKPRPSDFFKIVTPPGTDVIFQDQESE